MVLILVGGILALNTFGITDVEVFFDGWRLGFTGYMSLCGAVTLALCGLLYFWLKKRGSKLFAGL